MLFVKHFCSLLLMGLLSMQVQQQSTTQTPPPVKPKVTIPKEGGSFITTKEASELITRFRRNHPVSDFPYAEDFNSKLIIQLLQQKGATNLRLYFGEDVNKYSIGKKVKFVLVATNEQGVDIIGKVLTRISEKEAGFYPIKQVAALTHKFQNHYVNTEFPYAEKFNKKFIASLIQKRGAVSLRISLGEAVTYNKMLLKRNINIPKRIRMVLFAVNVRGDNITKEVLQRTGALISNYPAYRMVSNLESQDTESAVENGQQCLNMCNINSSALYIAQ